MPQNLYKNIEINSFLKLLVETLKYEVSKPKVVSFEKPSQMPMCSKLLS